VIGCRPLGRWEKLRALPSRIEQKKTAMIVLKKRKKEKESLKRRGMLKNTANPTLKVFRTEKNLGKEA